MTSKKTITFNTSGYDGFIDFIKAYAILCVLFGHTFGPILDKVAYGVWAGMQVPLFILVQAFHCYKKDSYKVKIGKVLKRVFLPFLVLELLTFLIALACGSECNSMIHNGLIGGGYGPGSYFPWIYIQVAVLLPFIAILFKNCKRETALIVFLIICEGFEVLFSYINISEEAYRLLCPRYLFLFFLGWLWAKDGVKINVWTILISSISFASIIYFEYFSVYDEPWFFTTGFTFHRWPCYFFVALGFTALLNKVWAFLSRYKTIVLYTSVIASASYEIFLLQMSIIYLFHSDSLFFVSSGFLRYGMWLLIVWIFSIVGGVYLHLIINKYKINDLRQIR